MRRSRKLVLYAGFAAASFVVALALGRPEVVALGAPFLLIVITGLLSARPATVHATCAFDRERLVEGEEIEAQLIVRADSPVALLDLALLLPRGIVAVDGAQRYSLGLKSGEERCIRVGLRAEHWGAYRIGDVRWRTVDRAGLLSREGATRGEIRLRVYPLSEKLRHLIAPRETQPFAGNRVARTRGEGIEFSDVQPYVPGDRPRQVNWRATSMRQTLHVNRQHPEHNSDVVIFLDSFAEASGDQGSTLDLAVRAAASLADHYLARRDRVGLVNFGGLVRWLKPSSGSDQVYRIVEALVETEVTFSFVWKDIDVLPPRSLTPQALVVALTPLLDERGIHALLDLRRRGFDLVVIELSPFPFIAGEGKSDDALAARFWSLWRDATRFRFEELGVAIVEWDGSTPLAAVVEEVAAFRRSARYASR